MFMRSFSKSPSAFLPAAAESYVACDTDAGASARRPDAVSGGKPGCSGLPPDTFWAMQHKPAEIGGQGFVVKAPRLLQLP